VLFESITSVLASSPEVDRELPSLLASLHKAITLDSALAAEAYHHASTRRLEEIVEDQKASQERLSRESKMDGLTQVFNRQAVMTSLEAEFLQCRAHQLPFSVMILDVDHFKQINDHHGHPFGDHVLRHVVEIVQNVMRPGDIVGRFGGDEIIVGLGRCNMEDAAKIAERIRLKVALTPFRHRRHAARITLSLGVACSCLSPRARTLDSVIDKADRALYRAKEKGRNRTCLAETGPTATGLPFPAN
jgi:diguanylate cyclase (GGDEF)-like protein